MKYNNPKSKMFLLLRTLALILASVPVVLACSPAAGTIDRSSDIIDIALGIFCGGVVIVVVNVAVFAYRARKKKEKSHRASWITLFLSIGLIPIAFLFILMSGSACGHGAIEGALFFAIFEVLGLAAQLISQRFSNNPTQSPIPLD